MRRVLVIAIVCCAHSAHADCPPTAVSSGDPALVRALGERLVASGVATTSTEGCPAIRVRVEQRGELVHLETVEGGQRQVRDLATAAVIVESWTRHEVEAGSLPDLAPPSIVVAARPRRATGLGIAFESSVGDDRSLWLGAAASGCLAMGPVCIGGVVRGARDTRATGETADIQHQGSELHAIATIDAPRRFGALTISPGIGAGYGYLAITSTHMDLHLTPTEETRSTHALRADVHLSIARPLGSGFALTADLRADTALARTENLAGPKSFMRAAIGIRFGAL